MNAHDLGDYSKSYLSQIGSIEPELRTILYKCPGKKKKKEKKKERKDRKQKTESWIILDI